MKNLKFIFASALVAFALAFVACDKDDDKDDPTPAPTEDVTTDPTTTDDPSVVPGDRPEVANPDADHIRIVVNYTAGCSDKVILSSWHTANNLDNALAFTQIAEGWFQLDVEASALTAEYSYDDNGETVVKSNTLSNCKILVGNADGVVAGDWSTQWTASVDAEGNPDDNNTVVIEGKAHLVGDMGSAAMQVEEDAAGTVIYITIGAVNDNPCKEKVQFSYIVFNVEVTDADILAAIAEKGLFVHGPFVDDSWSGLEMTKVDANNWTLRVDASNMKEGYQLQEGEQYNYTLAADNWNEKALMDDGSGDNRKANDREVYDQINYMENVKPYVQ